MNSKVYQEISRCTSLPSPPNTIIFSKLSNLCLTNLLPLGEVREGSHLSTPAIPKRFSQVILAVLTKERGVHLPETRTRRDNARNKDRNQKSTVVRKGTRNKVRRRHRHYPNIRTTNQINT